MIYAPYERVAETERLWEFLSYKEKDVLKKLQNKEPTLIFSYKNILFFSEPQRSYFLPILSLKMFLACSYF